MPKQTPLPGGFYYYADGEQRRESWNQIIAERQHDRWMENRNNLYQLAADTYDVVSLDNDGQGQFVMPLEEIVTTFFGYHPDALLASGLNPGYSDEFNRSYFHKWSFDASYWGDTAPDHVRDSYDFSDFINDSDDYFSINAFPRNMFVFKRGNSSELDTYLGFAPTTSAFVLVFKLSLGGETGGGRVDLFLADDNQEFIAHHAITPASTDQGPWYVVFTRAEGSTDYHLFTSLSGYSFWHEDQQTKPGTITRLGLRLTSTNGKRIWATLHFVRVYLGAQWARTGNNLKTT